MLLFQPPLAELSPQKQKVTPKQDFKLIMTVEKQVSIFKIQFIDLQISNSDFFSNFCFYLTFLHATLSWVRLPKSVSGIMLLSAYFTGIHRIDVDYAGEPVPGSPFFAKSYDSSKVVVRGICDGVVGRRCSFTGEYTHLLPLLSIKISVLQCVEYFIYTKMVAKFCEMNSLLQKNIAS